MNATLDPRINAFRDDIAAKSLERLIEAKSFIEPQIYEVKVHSTPVRKKPNKNLGYETEWIYGEKIDIYEILDDWAWGQSTKDGYVGFCEIKDLRQENTPPTHKVTALRTFIYEKPDIKTPPIISIPFLAELCVIEEGERFSRLKNGTFIFSKHISQLDVFSNDFVAEAERFIGIPYLWGGRTSLGLDCSALVQLSCEAAGIKALRDSDMQENNLGEKIAIPENIEDIKRGDLLFWPGHVAISQGEGRIIHANGFSMSVISENIETALKRIEEQHSPLRSVRRIM